jgi:hypothetical protein
MNHDETTGTTMEGGDDDDNQERWIDGLLRSSEAAAMEAAPAAVRVAASAAIGRARRRQVVRRSVAGFLAAAAVLVAVGAWRQDSPLPRRDGSGEGFQAPQFVRNREARSGSVNPSPSPSLPGRGRPTATFVSTGDAIAAPVASSSPEVTVVRLYPTISAERRWRREANLQVLNSRTNGG